MLVDCSCYWVHLRIICAYSPTEEGDKKAKKNFYKELSLAKAINTNNLQNKKKTLNHNMW